MKKDVCGGYTPWKGTSEQIRECLGLARRMTELNRAERLTLGQNFELEMIKSELGIGQRIHACAQKGGR